MLRRSREKGKILENWKMKTPSYFGERGKISPFSTTSWPIVAVAWLLKKAVLRRRICPQFLCGFIPMFSELDTEWAAVLDVDVWPKRALRILPAIHFECWVTSTSMRCFVFSGLRFLHTRKNSWPSSHNPPMLVKMNGMHEDSVRRRPFWSLRG